MKYFQSWQDFMRDPANKALKESKGIHACKQKYIQYQNKHQWYDPMILEHQSPGDSVGNQTSADGKSTQYITGNTAQVSTVTWNSGNNNITSSANQGSGSGELSADQEGFEASSYFDIEGFYLSGDGSTEDWTQNHTNSRYKFRCFLTTGSLAVVSKPAGFHGALTGSPGVSSSPGGNLLGGTAGITGSVFAGLKDAINNSPASAVVGGNTNGSIAPSTLFSATLNAGSSSLTITSQNAGSSANITSSYGTSDVVTLGLSVSGSMTSATTTTGKCTYEYDQGTQTFDATLGPWASMPRK